MTGSQLGSPRERLRAHGKALFAGDGKVHLRGVTYGTFRPRGDGSPYPPPNAVDRDFARMAAAGINAVRTYTAPPRWLLDLALRHRLLVVVGLAWEQHVAFLEDRHRIRSIEARVRAAARETSGHPAVACFAVGNEIPPGIARWHGRRRIEGFLERLYSAVKAEDSDALVTYVNYPSTEYLELPFLDLMCFNVYLEVPDRLEAYLARLQNIAGERPLVMTEIGLDSRRNGTGAQAEALDWQIRAAFDAGCAGAFVFAWTDEWHRGGAAVEDWDFGLTTRDRLPKAALEAVRRAFAEVPLVTPRSCPRVSVIVCTRDGARTLEWCLAGVERLEYPNYEVIVVDDGSTDESAEIASRHRARVISTPNRGLASARNTGLDAASGEIVAYLDDDARPDPHWLAYLAAAFATGRWCGVGGPNIDPGGRGALADAVAHAPGGPVHVLLSDREAEHVPGCNMAFRRDLLQEAGGFDPRFRVAGDDVDLCWRLREAGGRLGFSPGAVVWHRSRDSVGAYWRQQRGYGRAEALLAQQWPDKYSAGGGRAAWVGRLYGSGLVRGVRRRWRVYHGQLGTAPFQSLYQPATGWIESLPLTPEWYLTLAVLAALSAVGALWPPLLLVLFPLAIGVALSLAQAAVSAARAPVPGASRSSLGRLCVRGLIWLFHLLQPLARLRGRFGRRLAPGARGPRGFRIPRPRSHTAWSERWRAPVDWLRAVEARLQSAGATVRRGEAWDRWDLELRRGLLGGVRIRMAVEEHGQGRQLVRLRSWPVCSPAAALALALLAFAVAASFDGAGGIEAMLGVGGLALAARTVWEAGIPPAPLREAVERALATATVEAPVPAQNGTAEGEAGAPKARAARPALRAAALSVPREREEVR